MNSLNLTPNSELTHPTVYWKFLLGCQCCCCSVAKSCPTLEISWITACQAPLSSTVSWSLLKFMSIELVMLSNHLVLCHPLLFWPLIFPSIRVFSNESSLCIRWPKYWSLSFSISLCLQLEFVHFGYQFPNFTLEFFQNSCVNFNWPVNLST